MSEVIYIASASRSGSTLLGAYLARLPDVYTVGESKFWWTHGALDRCLCSCGVLPSQCLERWAAVGHAMEAGSLEEQRPHELLELAVEGSGAQFVVDESKDVETLGLLAANAPGQVRVIHLIRDPVGVAHSLARPKMDIGRVPPASFKRVRSVRAAAKWILDERAIAKALSDFTLASAVMQFENFVREPERAVELAMSRLGIGITIPELGKNVYPATNHTIWGNPIRMSSSVEIRHERQREASLGGTVVRLMARGHRRRLGYGN